MKTVLEKAIKREEGRIRTYKENNEPEDKIKMSEALVEATKKQIAKKLVYDDRDGDYECPNCGSYIGKSYFFFGEYCQECGQKLDRSGEEK